MSDEPSKRDGNGRFVLGSAGGPGRKAMDPEVRAMLEAATPKAAARLVEALDAELSITVGDEVVGVPSHDMRTKAANTIFDRLYGKAAQTVTGEDGQPLAMGIIILPAEDLNK